MRMALIHPVMPGGGRDLTINYSPSRSRLSPSLCNDNRCVFCKYCPETNFEGKRQRARGGRQRSQNDILENFGDDMLMADDESDLEEDHRYLVDKGTGFRCASTGDDGDHLLIFDCFKFNFESCFSNQAFIYYYSS